MIPTVLGQMVCWFGGALICYCSLPPKSRGRTALAVGMGWPISQAFVIIFILALPLSLSVISVIAIAFFTMVSLFMSPYYLNSSFTMVQFREPRPFIGSSKHWLGLMTIGSLIILHLSINGTSDLAARIFPWDAFTTWIYRAKAWVLADQILAIGSPADWLNGDLSKELAIYANEYPRGVSGLAAFSSSLTGAWDSEAATLPWLLALMTSGTIIFGLGRAIGLGALTSLFGTYLTISCPIVATHTALAGYADLWMLLFSGCGLACLLASRIADRKDLIFLAFILLLVATQLKWEAWIWLILSIGFCLLELFFNRFGYLRFFMITGISSFTLWATGVKQVSLGPLGLWGLTEDRLNFGLFGDFLLRSYNPSVHYWDSLFLSSNFHFLATLYLGSLIFTSLKCPKKSIVLWLMFGLIAITQWIIFGVSIFSFYAETGTAINRLLMQFVPVMTLTVIYAAGLLFGELGPSKKNKMSDAKDNKNMAWHDNVTSPIVLAVACIALSLTFSLSISSLSRIDYSASQLEAKVGKTIETAQGIMFKESPLSVGVLGRNVSLTSSQSHRYLQFNISSDSKTDVAFYWINEGQPLPHIKKINHSGKTIVDTQHLGSWGRANIVELGFIVPKERFGDTTIISIALLSNLDFGDMPGIINTWIETERFNHVSINWLKSRSSLDPSLPKTLNIAASLLMVLLLIASRSNISRLTRPSVIGLVLLWVISDAVWLKGFAKATRPQFVSDGKRSIDYFDTGQHLPQLTQEIQFLADSDKPIIVMPADAPARLDAERMPFELLPNRAIFSEGNINRIPRDWAGYILLIARNDSKLKAMEIDLSKHFGSEPNVELNAPRARLLSY